VGRVAGVAIFHASISSGKVQGMICPTHTGTRRTQGIPARATAPILHDDRSGAPRAGCRCRGSREVCRLSGLETREKPRMLLEAVEQFAYNSAPHTREVSAPAIWRRRARSFDSASTSVAEALRYGASLSPSKDDSVTYSFAIGSATTTLVKFRSVSRSIQPSNCFFRI